MNDVTVRALGFACLIALGFVMRARGCVGGAAQRTLSGIMLTVTLPAAIACNLNGSALHLSDAYFIVLGAGFNACALLVAWLYGRRAGKAPFAMVNLAGYNIGCFAMPFISGLMGQAQIVQASLFDIGNSIMCLAVNYALAEQVERGSGLDVRALLREVAKSIPVWAYVAMCALCVAGWALPKTLMAPLEIAGAANPFIAMMVIGVSIRLPKSSREVTHIARYCAMRLALSAACVGAVLLTPLPMQAKLVLGVLCFAPISAVSPVFTDRLGGDTGMSASINSAYVLISITCMSAIIGIFG